MVITKTCTPIKLLETKANLNMKDPQYHQMLYQNPSKVSKCLMCWKMLDSKNNMANKSKRLNIVTKIV